MQKFRLKIHIAASRWFKHGGAELWQQITGDAAAKEVVLTSPELTKFIAAATVIPYWVDDDIEINPEQQHTITWLLEPETEN